MKKGRKWFYLFSIVFLSTSLFHECSFSQSSPVQALIATRVRSIGDTLFFGITDFDFLPDGSLIVVDKQDYKIKHVSRAGKLLAETGKRGKEKGAFTTGPFLVAVGKSYIAVADYSSPRVQLFTHALNAVREFHVRGFVMALKFDSQDNLWIGTHGGRKDLTCLLQYDTNGSLQREIPLTHAGDNIFQNLYFFTIVPGDTLVVGYAFHNRFEDYFQSYLGSWQLAFFPPASRYTALEENSNVQIPSEEIIYGICADKNGFLYILGGDFAFNPFRDIFVVNRKKELKALFQLPVESGKILIDKEGTLWSLESNRTILTQYTITAENAKSYEAR